MSNVQQEFVLALKPQKSCSWLSESFYRNIESSEICKQNRPEVAYLQSVVPKSNCNSPCCQKSFYLFFYCLLILKVGLRLSASIHANVCHWTSNTSSSFLLPLFLYLHGILHIIPWLPNMVQVIIHILGKQKLNSSA